MLVPGKVGLDNKQTNKNYERELMKPNRTELNVVGLEVQHIRAARGQGLIINSVAPLREGGRQK